MVTMTTQKPKRFSNKQAKEVLLKENLELRSKFKALEKAVSDKNEETIRLTKLWMESRDAQGRVIGLSTQLETLQKRMLVVEHIAAGRTNEAILEMLRPLPMVFTLDIRMDDPTRKKAEDAMLEKVKKIVTDQVAAVAISREEKTDGTN